MTFDPVTKILGPRVRRDRYSYNKDEPVKEIKGFDKKELRNPEIYKAYQRVRWEKIKQEQKAKKEKRKENALKRKAKELSKSHDIINY